MLDAIVRIFGTVANVVSNGAYFYKEFRGNEIGPEVRLPEIEPEAFAEMLKVENTKLAEIAVVEESATVDAATETALPSVAKEGKSFFYMTEINFGNIFEATLTIVAIAS